jgi:probable F420-dependent oxidoreductase
VTTPQLSITLRTFSAEDPGGWGHMLDVARAADAAGIDRLLVSDHVVFGEDLEAYGRPESGGVEGGRQPTGPDGHWLEPMTVLAHVAALTTRIRLGTNILLAALRRPVVLAKSASTLDVLSGGRLDLGVGIGWQREEYDAAGLDFGARGRLLDESLALLHSYWTQPYVSGELTGVAYDRIHMMPKPLQPGGVPLWISGRCNPRVAERLARFGRAWIPWGDDATDPVASIPRMRAAVAVAGGDASSYQVAGTLPVVRDGAKKVDLVATMARVPELVAAGVTDFRAHVAVPDSYDGVLETYAELVDAFRGATAE